MTTAVDLRSLPDAREVPTPPTAAVRILEIRSDADAGVRELADAVRSDPALAAKLLATANSALYRRSHEITSVDRAISMIGRNSFITIALAFSVASSVPTNGQIGGVPMTTYWSHSVLTAAAARNLAHDLAPGWTEEAFLVGLISELGRVMLALAACDVYEPLATAEGGWPSLDKEREALGFTSYEATATVLDAWGMPAAFVAAIEHAENPALIDEDADHEVKVLATITHLASAIAAFYVGDGDGDALRDLTSKATTNGVSGETLDRTLDLVQEQVGELAAQLTVPLSARDYGATIAEARTQLVEQALKTDALWHRERERREELERNQAAIEAEARRDLLTGLPNRRAFAEQFEQHIKLRLRADEGLHKSLGVILMDIDHFKSINDTHGHDVGDAVLAHVGKVLSTITRGEEMVARYGGEEFILLAPAATAEELVNAGERLRKAIEAIEIDVADHRPLNVTISSGVATMRQPGTLDDGTRLLKAADDALYEAKRSGRNRVVASRADLG